MNPLERFLEALKEAPLAAIEIVLLFIVIFSFYNGLQESGLGNNEYANATLEAGKQATVNIFNGWIIAGTPTLLILFGLVVYWFYDNHIRG